jgi:hypothetical protein
MELTYVTIVVLASMVFVLAGMVGYVYWQQTRMLQHLQSLALALATHVEITKQPVQQEDEEEEDDEKEDDRVSVEDKERVEVVDGPLKQQKEETQKKEDDVDDLQDKTATELKELLTKKGIPFGKRDSKPVLIQLLKATA